MRAAGLTAALIGGALLAACSGGAPPSGFGDPGRGKITVIRESCGSCHDIPGVQAADGVAGPPLGGFAGRTVVAGMAPNTPENLIRWLKSPQAVVPGNAMPDMGLTDRQAADVAAFLYTLR
jgi:cytochrome c2